MCADCRERYELNPLRILDCKESKCQQYIDEAPAAVDSLCVECKQSFSEVIKFLDYQAVPFKVNKRLVRGLDYYTRTTFEIISKSLGAQNAISGGGRYDTLVGELGGKAIPAVGFAVGLERIVQLMSNDKCQMTNKNVRRTMKKTDSFLNYLDVPLPIRFIRLKLW